MNHLLGDLCDIWFPIRLPNAYYLATPSDRFLLALGGSCTSTSGRYGMRIIGHERRFQTDPSADI